MYFDPGTGSMLIPVLLGAIPVVAAFFIGIRKKLFKKKGDNEPAEAAAEIPAAEEKPDSGFEDIDDE